MCKDPTRALKKQLNSIVKSYNSVCNYIKLPVLIGEYNPGYIYGKYKIHKNVDNPPIRPIISQIPSPTYNIAKTLNKLITPFSPTNYSLKDTDELLDLIKTTRPIGILAPLDVESLHQRTLR